MCDRSFIDKVLAGDASTTDIDDYVDAWHADEADDRSLAEYLGFTKREYEIWAVSPDRLEQIVAARRERRAAPEVKPSGSFI